MVVVVIVGWPISFESPQSDIFGDPVLEKDILRFQVTVDQALGMRELQALADPEDQHLRLDTGQRPCKAGKRGVAVLQLKIRDRHDVVIVHPDNVRVRQLGPVLDLGDKGFAGC